MVWRASQRGRVRTHVVFLYDSHQDVLEVGSGDAAHHDAAWSNMPGQFHLFKVDLEKTMTGGTKMAA